MTEFLQELWLQAQATSRLEGIAVLAAVLYLLLAIRQNIACWIFAAISTSIYIYVMFQSELYMESSLNVFYLVMAGYGFYSWRTQRSGTTELKVSTRPLRWHVPAIAAVVLLSLSSGALLSATTDAAFPYMDSATTWSSIWATYLVARKVLENWWYWLLIDLVSIFIFWERGLLFTAALFAVYVAMIPLGYVSWRRSMLAHAV